MAISLACSGWMFYELFSGGRIGIFAACASCAMQTVAYGLVANMAGRGKTKRATLAFTACIFSISITINFIAVSSFLQHGAQAMAQSSYVTSLKQTLIAHKQKQSELSLAAAEQGIPERYRTQGREFIALSQKSNREIEELINDFSQSSQPAALPTYSAWQWANTVPYAMTVFALVMALLFDLTPVVSFFYLSPGTAGGFTRRTSGSEGVDWQPYPSPGEIPQRRMVNPYVLDPEYYELAKEKIQFGDTSPEHYDDAIAKIRSGELEPTYRAICKAFNISNPKAKAILENAVRLRVLVRDNKGFRLNENEKA